MHLFAQPPLRSNAEAVAHDQHPDHQFRINRRAADLTVERPQVRSQARQIDEATAVAKSQGLPTVAGFAKVGGLIGYAGWPAVLVGAVLVGAALTRRVAIDHGVSARRAVAPAAVGDTGRHAAPADAAPRRPPRRLTTRPPGRWAPPPPRPGLDCRRVAARPARPRPGGVRRAHPRLDGAVRFATPVWVLAPFVIVLAGAEVVAGLRWRGRALLGAVTVAAAALSGAGFATDVATFRDAPTAPMCLIVTNTGREFNGYMDILGLRSATFFAPEIGCAALTGRALLFDGGGLAQPTIARFWAAKDPAGIRDCPRRRQTHLHPRPRPVPAVHRAGRRPAVPARLRRDRPHPQHGRQLGAPRPRPRRRHDGEAQGMGVTALAADAAQRATPHASCGDRLVVGSTF